MTEMARIVLLTLLVCASLLSCGSTTTKPSGSTTTKPTTVHTTSPPNTEPLTESPDLEKNNTFILYDHNKHEVCLKMIINMTVVYTYTNASNPNKTVTQLDPMDGLAEIVYTDNRSFCQLNGKLAQLTLMWVPKDGEGADQRTMTFYFNASYEPNRRHWIFDSVYLDVVFSSVDFPFYQNISNISMNNISYEGAGFFDDEVEFERGYQCLASRDHDLTNLTDHQITAKVTVEDFLVQAFAFKKAGEFGNVRKCLADSGNGKKIVPIAVGIALAVLVVAVIIAFIISKLVNRRRQTSYETLN